MIPVPVFNAGSGPGSLSLHSAMLRSSRLVVVGRSRARAALAALAALVALAIATAPKSSFIPAA